MLMQITTPATADTQVIAEQTVFAPLAAAGGLKDLTAAVAARSMEANAVEAAEVRTYSSHTLRICGVLDTGQP